MKTPSSNNRTEEILQSLDGMAHAAAPDYFYTKLLGRMQQQVDTGKRSFVLLRPAVLMTVLSVILIINIGSLVLLNKTSEKKTADIETFADAYNFNSSSLYQ